MARSSTSQIADFLLHARTIHASLVTTAFLLFATMLGLPASDLKIARRDLERIQIALASGEINKLAQRAYLLAGRGKGLWKSKSSGTYTWEFDFGELDRTVTVSARLYHRGIDFLLPIEEQLIPRIAPGERGRTETCDTIIQPSRTSYVFNIEIPDRPSLADMRRLWNCLGRLQVGSVIGLNYLQASPIPLVEQLTKDFPNNFLGVRARSSSKEVFTNELENKSIPALFVEEYDGFLFLEFSPGAYETGEVAKPSELGLTPRKYTNSDDTDGPLEPLYTIPIRIPMSMRYFPLDAQSLVIDEFFPGIRPGEFDRRFKVLSEWSGSRANRPIDVLLEDIENDLTKSSDTIELFGAKVPIKAVAVVGSSLVSLLQGYLAFHLLHLQAAFPRLKALPPVPWIGAMAGPWPKLMTAASAVGVPTVMAGVLLFRSYETIGPTIAAIALTVLIAASLFWA